MTWTYDPTTLGTSAMTRMRLALGDTDSSAQLFQDEELNYFITQRSTEFGACADACRSLASRFSREVDTRIADLSGSWSQQSAQWASRALQFDKLAATSGGVIPYSGGTSISDMESVRSNQDRVAPQFFIGMNDSKIPAGPPGPVEGGDGTQ